LVCIPAFMLVMLAVLLSCQRQHAAATVASMCNCSSSQLHLPVQIAANVTDVAEGEQDSALPPVFSYHVTLVN
jgi:hypothetical protein